MRHESVVLLPSPFNKHLGLFEGIENLPIENVISQLSIEGFVVSILPGAARLDKEGLNPDPHNAVRHIIGLDLTRAMTIAIDSRLYSSMKVRILIARASCVLSAIKS